MGKRQIGEMAPFELVITLILAEVACIPMSDPFIPLYYGLVPIITLGTLHLLLSFISRKSMALRKLFSGNSVIVIDKGCIQYNALKKTNLNLDDLLESVRSAGYPDFNKIEYAIFETNGKFCVIEKASDPTKPTPPLLPITLFSDGTWDAQNLKAAGLQQSDIEGLFARNGYQKPKDILYADIRQDGLVYVSPKYGKFFTETVSIEGGAGW